MTDPSDQYFAAPLEDNMFDWHFTIRGPRDTEFAGGVYHGRILLPSDYPFKPPNIILLTSVRWTCPQCGDINALIPEEREMETATESKYASQIAQLHIHNMETPDVQPDHNADASSEPTAAPAPADSNPPSAVPSLAPPPLAEVPADTNDLPVPVPPLHQPAPAPVVHRPPTPPTAVARRQPDFVDSVLQGISTALLLALIALVYKKLLHLNGNMIAD
ncbi:hypothetical protein DYB26_004575 [Aphanomyces astaci]|uniref:UBC core domain-containing protein n=1 Tax=Aphanomyces astaci TaxID=112090 RepID=A0A3R7BRW8_APHAT|nr:hypothetical protein DYB26_004575 [Aphanomyces astaci]